MDTCKTVPYDFGKPFFVCHDLGIFFCRWTLAKLQLQLTVCRDVVATAAAVVVVVVVVVVAVVVEDTADGGTFVND